MAGNSNIEIKLKFLSEHLDSIDQGVKKLEDLKKQALTTGSILKTALEVDFIRASLEKLVEGFHEVQEAIKMGEELELLSARTGETVGNLVVLQQAFKNAGMDAGSVGMVINKLQKAMTGVNEEGQPTAKAFDALGVSVDALKTMSATEQLETLTKAFSSMPNPADRARAAMEMFGRGGGEMLGILSKADSIEEARKQVGSLAETMEKNAASFHELEDAWGAIGIRMTQLFAGIAEKVAPLLQHIADEANKLDFAEVGKEIGDLVVGLTKLLNIVVPVAVALGASFVLEKTIAGLAAFRMGLASNAAGLAAETTALMANSAAQTANAAARRGTAAGAGAAWGKPAAPGGPTFGGAPFSKEAYDAARNMGMPASEALAAARRAMDSASKVAMQGVPIWTRLTGAMGGAAAGLEKFLAGVFTLPNLLAAAFAKIGVDFMLGQAKRFGYSQLGGETDEEDQKQADKLRKEKSDQYEALSERVKNVNTQDERDALLEEISKLAEEDSQGIVSSKDAGAPRAAQNLVLKNSVKNLSLLQGTLTRKEDLLSPEEVSAEDAANASRDRVEADRLRQEAARKSRAEAEQNQKFAEMTPQEQLADVQKRRAEKEAAAYSISGTNEEKDASKVEADKLFAEELALKGKIAGIDKQQGQKKVDALSEEAEKKAQNADKLESLRLELEINEAMDAGNTKLAEGLKWNRDRVRFQKELQELGSTDSWGESARMANEAMGKPSDGPKPPANLEAGFLTQLFARDLGPAVDAKPVDRLPEVVTNTAKIETAIKELTTVVTNKVGDVFT